MNRLSTEILAGLIIALVCTMGGYVVSDKKNADMVENIQEIKIATSGLPRLQEDVKENAERGINNSLAISEIKAAVK